MREHNGRAKQRLEQALLLRPAGARLHPAEHATVLDEPHAIPASQVGRRQRAGAAHRGVDDRHPVRPDVRQRVDHDDDVGVALRVVLGDVELAEPQGRAPVHVPDLIAWRERADLSRLDAVARRGRDVVADRRLRARRARQTLHRGQARIDGDRRACLVSRLARGEAERFPHANVRAAEDQALASGTAKVERPATFLSRAQREERVVAPALDGDQRRQRLEQLEQRHRRAGAQRHGDRHPILLDDSIGRDLVREFEHRRPARSSRDHQRDDERNRDDHDVGAARQHSEEERPADERQERDVQGRRAPGHEASVTGLVTRSAGRVTASPAGWGTPSPGR